MSVPVITIDGPSASGKGTIAHRVAEQLGWHCLDSGALYRIVALAGARRGILLDDERALTDMVIGLQIVFGRDQILVDGEDVTDAIRGEDVGAGASRVAALPALRSALLQRQRNFAVLPGLVADGRDMGTVVFPDAPLKIFLTASAEERAARRYNQLINKGESVSLSALLDDIQARDLRDAGRQVAPLRPADTALVIDSTWISVDEVVKAVMDQAVLLKLIH